MNMPNSAREPINPNKLLIAVFGLALLIQVSSLMIANHMGTNWLIANLPLHAGIEMCGSVLTFMTAHLLLRLDTINIGIDLGNPNIETGHDRHTKQKIRRPHGFSLNRIFAAALIAMGGLDGLHALMPAGNTFVWLHSSATAAGGFFFALICLPRSWTNPLQNNLPIASVLLVLLVGGYSLLWPMQLPRMLANGAFSANAIFLNMLGGVCMLAAASHLFVRYRRSGSSTELLFCLQCILFGSAALLFQQSRLWDAPWWVWHALRLCGYGLALWLVVVHTNLSTRQRVETHLQHSNRALLSTLDLHAIVSIADCSGYIIDVNDAFCRTSGYRRDELIGKNHRIVNSGTHSPTFWLTMWRDITSGKSWHGEMCNRAKDGSLYWVDTVIAPFMDNSGKIEKYISIRTNITASKNAVAALAQERKRLDYIIEGANVGTWEWNIPSGEARFDERWAAQLGYTLAELEPTTVDTWIGLCHPEDMLTADAILQRHFREEIDYYEVEIRMRHKTGHWVWILARGRVSIRATDSSPQWMFGTSMNITTRAQATQAAEAASRAKSQFLANMSHEIRTPMHAVLGMLTLLRKTALSPRQADYSLKAESAARSLLGLLNNILDFSKIDAGKMLLDLNEFKIDLLLHDLSVILSIGVGTKPVEVLFDIDPTMPHYVIGDAMRLQQVLVNLGGNAIKFTEKGEVVIAIHVLQKDSHEVTLKISVRDSGIGIAPENQARIFSGFTQAEASTTRRFGGTGLGVAISQRLVEMMGGKLELESSPGKGSLFYFKLTLPLADTAIDEVPHNNPYTGPTTPWRTLVIDDNPTALDVLKRMGQSLGWMVDVVESGEAGLALLQAQATTGIFYQAVFVDWQMPGLDGWETSRRIRQLGLTGEAPVVVMVTAHDREMLAQRSDSEQALLDGFLVKPVTASMLFNAAVDARYGHALSHPSQIDHSSGTSLAGMRILVVEDNLNNQQVARELLEGEGAFVQIANHGQEAVTEIAITKPAFDVVLMDLQMPVMDGFTATRCIREDMKILNLPIIAMTANAMASDRDACLQAGMNDHVGKPFSMNHLIRVLHQHTGRFDESAKSNDVEADMDSDITLPKSLRRAATTAGVDISTALNRLGGKQKIYLRMLQAFVTDLIDMPEQLHSHITQHQTQAASRLLHSLKGLAATLGANALSAVAARGEQQLNDHATEVEALLLAQEVTTAINAAGPGLSALLLVLQSAQSGADTQATDIPVDTNALYSALQAMLLHLQSSNLVAIDAMAEIQRQFGASIGEQLQDMDDAIAELDFERALRACHSLIEGLVTCT